MYFLRGIVLGLVGAGVSITDIAMWKLVHLGDAGEGLKMGVTFLSIAFFVAVVIWAIEGSK